MVCCGWFIHILTIKLCDSDCHGLLNYSKIGMPDNRIFFFFFEVMYVLFDDSVIT
jgi:hypothetical protein